MRHGARELHVLRLGEAAAHDGRLHRRARRAVEQRVGLGHGHVPRGKAGDGFENVSGAKSGFLRGAIGQHGNDHDVAEALGHRGADFTARRILLLFLVVGVFAGAQIGGIGVQGFEQAVERSGGDGAQVGLVHVVFLDVLEDLAVNGQGAIGLVVVGLAEEVAETHVAEHQERQRNDDSPAKTVHGFLLARQSGVPSPFRSIPRWAMGRVGEVRPSQPDLRARTDGDNFVRACRATPLAGTFGSASGRPIENCPLPRRGRWRVGGCCAGAVCKQLKMRNIKGRGYTPRANHMNIKTGELRQKHLV